MDERLRWRRADTSLALLAALGVLVTLLAALLSQGGLEGALALVVTVCRRTLDEMLAHGFDLGRLSLLLPPGLGLLLMASEALRLLRASRAWMQGLDPVRCPPPERLECLAALCDLEGRVTLVCADGPLAFTHGWLRPQVWLSTGLLRTVDDSELEAVLRHEAHHVQARDPLKILAVRCLARALFFVPVARDLAASYSVAKELAADEHAAAAMCSALPLARTLRKMIAADPTPLPGATLAGDADTVQARLLAMLEPARPVPVVSSQRLSVSIVLLLAVFVVAFAPMAGHMPSLSECTVV